MVDPAAEETDYEAGRPSGRGEAWIREAKRLSSRYRREIVEGCGLCPWAERARTDGRIAERVLLDTEARVDATVRAIEEFVADAKVLVAFLIYPRLSLSRSAFETFAARVRVADAGRHPLGEIPFVLAAFHPDATADLAGA